MILPDGTPLPHEKCPMAVALREGRSFRDAEVNIRQPDGAIVPVMVNIDPIVNQHGRVIGAINVFYDVSEIKRAEDALRDSEERFRMLADHMAQLAWTCDQLGNTTWYNRRWFDYTGLSFEETKDWGWTSCHHPDHLDHVVASVTRSRETGEPWEDTFPLRGKDGQYRWFLSRAVPIRDETGRIVRWFGTNTDVTEQRAAEEALRDADRRKDEFLAMLAHELRNPLAPIRTGLQVVQLYGDDRETTASTLEMMDRQVQQLVRLIDDLLDISRITRGKIELRREPCDLRTILSMAIEGSRPAIEAAGLEITVSMPRQDVELDADPARLSQVFLNLLINAAKYTDRGGHIWLERRTERVRRGRCRARQRHRHPCGHVVADFRNVHASRQVRTKPRRTGNRSVARPSLGATARRQRRGAERWPRTRKPIQSASAPGPGAQQLQRQAARPACRAGRIAVASWSSTIISMPRNYSP